MIVDIKERGDALVIGGRALFRFDHARAHQVADCLGAVLIPAQGDHIVDRRQQFVVDRNGYPLHAGTFTVV